METHGPLMDAERHRGIGLSFLLQHHYIERMGFVPLSTAEGVTLFDLALRRPEGSSVRQDGPRDGAP